MISEVRNRICIVCIFSFISPPPEYPSSPRMAMMCLKMEENWCCGCCQGYSKHPWNIYIGLFQLSSNSPPAHVALCFCGLCVFFFQISLNWYLYYFILWLWFSLYYIRWIFSSWLEPSWFWGKHGKRYDITWSSCNTSVYFWWSIRPQIEMKNCRQTAYSREN